MAKLTAVFIAVLVLIGGCETQDRTEYRVRHPQLNEVEEQVRRSIENALARWRQQLDSAQLPSQRAQAYAQLGQIYLAHHFNEAAADALEFATSQLKTNPHWYFYYATALERSFRLNEAQSALSSSLELRDHAEVRFLRANVRARLDDVTGALDDIRHLKERVELANSEPVNNESRTDAPQQAEAAWLALEAELLAREHRYADSQQRLATAIELAPEADALKVPAALLSRLSGNQRQAQQLIRAAGSRRSLAEQPLTNALSALSRGAQYYLQRGRGWMQQRNFQQAVKDFETAADIAPSSHDALLAYARALEIVGDVDSAERLYLGAEALKPDSAITQYFLGMLYERRLEDEKSRIFYAKAVDSEPTYLPPRLALAHAMFRNTDYEAALIHYSQYAQAREDDLETHYYAGLAALALGDCETAPLWFAQAVTINSHSRSAQEGLARSYAVCSVDPDELSQAQDIGERLEENRPDAAAAATLAMIHAAQGDWESTIAFQNIAIRRSDEERINGQRDRLTRYESGDRAKVAWLTGDPVFDPPRLTMRVLQ